MKINFKKKYFIILFILLTLLLSGCGIYNLNNFVLPDDAEFLALVEELDTPQKICQYMEDNFEYESHPYIILTPYQLYVTKKGDCDDCSTFAIFIANYHGYETYQILIFYKNNIDNHMIAIYRENDLYNFSDNQYYFIVNYDNFLDIVRFHSLYMYYCYGYIWSKYIVYDYDMNITEQGTK